MNRNILGNNLNVSRKTDNSRSYFNVRTEIIDGELNPILPAIGGYMDLKILKSKRIFQNSLSKVRLKWNGSRNFKMPSLNDLYWNPGGNPNLKPEIGYSADVGLKLRLFNDKLQEDGGSLSRDHTIDITGFYSDISDWIIWTPNGQFWEPQNIKRVRNSGVEMSYSVWRQISADNERGGFLQLNYAFTNNKVIESAIENDAGINKSLIFIPKHNVQYTLRYFHKDWTITFSQAITSKVFIDAANTSYMPYYAPSSLLLSKSFNRFEQESIKLSFKVNNLFNEEYQVMPNRPMPGINFRIMAEVKF